MYFPCTTCDLHSVSLHHQCRMVDCMQLCVPFLSLFPSVSLRVNSYVLEGLLTTWIPCSTQLTSVKYYIRYIIAFLFCQDGLECAALKLILLVLGCQIGIGDQSTAAYLYQTLVYRCAVRFPVVSDLIPWRQKSVVVFL